MAGDGEGWGVIDLGVLEEGDGGVSFWGCSCCHGCSSCCCWVLVSSIVLISKIKNILKNKKYIR